jgi:F0F1-type ATP synthase assembly protein I
MPEAVLSVIGTFLCTMILGITYLKNRHRERLALIQYNKDYTVFGPQKSNANSSLKFGLILLSIGAGLFIGGIFDKTFDTDPLFTFAFIFIFGGLSLVFYHRSISRQESQQNIKSPKSSSSFDDDHLV